jgi:hypothetical protein
MLIITEGNTITLDFPKKKREDRGKITLEVQYGPVKPNTEYSIIKEGSDFVTIRCGGKPVNVPNHLLTRVRYRRGKPQEDHLPSYEEIIEAEEV